MNKQEAKNGHYRRAFWFAMKALALSLIFLSGWVYVLYVTQEKILLNAIVGLIPCIAWLSFVYKDKATKEIEEADKIDTYGEL